MLGRVSPTHVVATANPAPPAELGPPPTSADAGFGLTAAFIGAAGVVVLRYRRVMSRASMVVLGATVLVAIPFLLPGMHERYFYLADALLIVAAFYRPSWRRSPCSPSCARWPLTRPSSGTPSRCRWAWRPP